ncbi:Global transcription regulator sge1, partial [Dimargaris xerosporica]
MSESDVSCQRGSKETFFGFVETTKDALLLFQAVHRGRLPIVERRFTETEKQAIRPGSIFIFNERDSGIKRWTDGITWSPSRIEANFLRYQELAEKIPPSQKHEYFIPPCESDTTGLSAAVALDDELDDALKGFTSNARRDSKVFPSERLAEYHRSLNNDHPGLETGYIHGQKLLPHHPNTHVYIGSKGIFYIKKGGLVKKTFS